MEEKPKTSVGLQSCAQMSEVCFVSLSCVTIVWKRALQLEKRRTQGSNSFLLFPLCVIF